MTLNLLKPVLGLLLVVNLVTAKELDFEFGKKVKGEHLIYDHVGILPYEGLRVPQVLGSVITHVKLLLLSNDDLTAKYDWQSGEFDIESRVGMIRPTVYKVQAYAVGLYPPHKDSQ